MLNLPSLQKPLFIWILAQSVVPLRNDLGNRITARCETKGNDVKRNESMTTLSKIEKTES